MRGFRWLLAGVILVGVACGGGGDTETGDTSGANAAASFDLSTLPDDFPSALVPPAYDTGEYLDIEGLRTASFNSSMPFDDAVAFYTAELGEPNFIGGDEGETLAQWSIDQPWVVSVFDGDQIIIGITALDE